MGALVGMVAELHEPIATPRKHQTKRVIPFSFMFFFLQDRLSTKSESGFYAECAGQWLTPKRDITIRKNRKMDG